MNQWYPRVPYRRALFVKSGSRGRVFAYEHEDLAVDVRHESTHALLHASLPMVPLWLDEGLAEYFEVAESQRAFDHPHSTALETVSLYWHFVDVVWVAVFTVIYLGALLP